MKDPQATHRIEQVGGAFRELAAMLASYRDSLMAEGFTRQEAMTLAVAYQTTFVATMKKGGESWGS